MSGPSFSRDLIAHRPATVQLIVDGRKSNTALIILGYASRIIADFNGDWLKAHGEALPPAQLVLRAWFNPNLESQWFIVPGIVALLTLVVTMVVTALTVAREREAGTFEQLLVTPFRPFGEILIGKSVPAVVIGLAEGTVIIAVGVFWFGVPLRGDLLLLYAWLLLLYSRRDRRRADDLIDFPDPAAGYSRGFPLRRAGGDPLRLRHADRREPVHRSSRTSRSPTRCAISSSSSAASFWKDCRRRWCSTGYGRWR